MRNCPTAYFVRLPFNLGDLKRPHLLAAERPYAVEKAVTLPALDYENFICDMSVSRRFIEEDAGLCRIDGGIWRCILVRRRGGGDGVLVMSGGRSFPLWAAYLHEAGGRRGG